MPINESRYPATLNRRSALRGAALSLGAFAAGQALGSPAGAQAQTPAQTRREETAVVIGSGFGGAVAALRLGQAGVRTTVFERGRRWPIDPAGSTFCTINEPDRRSAWFADHPPINPLTKFTHIDRYPGLIDRVRGNGIDALYGSGVGGGSLAFGAFTPQPRRQDFVQVFPTQSPTMSLSIRPHCSPTRYRHRSVLSYEQGAWKSVRQWGCGVWEASAPTSCNSRVWWGHRRSSRSIPILRSANAPSPWGRITLSTRKCPDWRIPYENGRRERCSMSPSTRQGFGTTFDQTLGCVRRGGRVVTVGMSGDTVSLGTTFEFGASRRSVLGHFGYRNEDIATLAKLVSTGRLDLTRSISRIISLEDIATGIEDLEHHNGDPIRILVKP